MLGDTGCVPATDSGRCRKSSGPIFGVSLEPRLSGRVGTPPAELMLCVLREVETRGVGTLSRRPAGMGPRRNAAALLPPPPYSSLYGYPNPVSIWVFKSQSPPSQFPDWAHQQLILPCSQ